MSDAIGGVGSSTAPVSQPTSAGAIATGSSGEASPEPTGTKEASGSPEHLGNSGCVGSMNTEDFLVLHNNSAEELPNIDLKKLIEMMIALELLKEVNKAE